MAKGGAWSMSESGPDSRHKDAGWAGRTCGNERGGGANARCAAVGWVIGPS